jgi:hypothetical protein
MNAIRASSERLEAVYRIPARTAREPLERALVEACRRHRAAPGEATVTVDRPTGDAASATLTVATSLPGSTEHRGRDAFLRDVATILDEAAPGAWQRVGLRLTAD